MRESQISCGPLFLWIECVKTGTHYMGVKDRVASWRSELTIGNKKRRYMMGNKENHKHNGKENKTDKNAREEKCEEQEKQREKEKHKDERIEENGQITLDENDKNHKIHLITIIGEIEGHDNLSSSSKTTKYEHVLPQLAAIEDSKEIDGVLILLNTMGGDVEYDGWRCGSRTGNR